MCYTVRKMAANQTPKYIRTVKYDIDVLNMLMSKAKDLNLDRKVKQQMRSTLEVLLQLKAGNGKFTEVYKHSANTVGNYGRYYAKCGGMAYVHRPARGALVRKFYHDLDMVNSIPNFLIQFARKHGRTLPHLEKYVNERDSVHAMLIEKLGFQERVVNDIVETPRDLAKRCVNAVCNGESLSKHLDNDKKKVPFLASLQGEIQLFAKYLATLPEHAELYKWTMDNKKSIMSFASKIIQREEATALIKIDEYLQSIGRVTASWIYDGLFVEKADGEETLSDDILAGCVAYVKQHSGYDIALKVKPFEPYPWIDEEMAKWLAMSESQRIRLSTFVNHTNTNIATVEVNKRWVSECLEGVSLDTTDTLLINSHLGTGKTTEAVKMMRDYKRILVVSARKTFTRFIIGDLRREGLDFEAYDAKVFGPLADLNRVVCQVESLWKLEENYRDYDFVVVDESETVLSQFHSATTHKDNIRANHIMFERIVKNATKVLFADAFVGQRTLTASSHLRPVARSLFINNRFCPYKRTAHELYSVREDEEGNTKTNAALIPFCNRIVEDLKAKKRVVVVWTSLKKAEAFVETHLKDSNYKWRLYSSKSSASENKELENVEAAWSDLDCLMMTTSITVGINYNPDDEALLYDKLYLYGCAKSALPRDIAQCLLRCRRIKTNELIYTIDKTAQYTGLYSEKDIRAEFKRRREHFKSADPIINWNDAPQWVEDNFVMNEREVALKSIAYKSIVEDYLQRSGYDLSASMDNTEGSLTTPEMLDAGDIDVITECEAEKVRKAIMSGLASDYERQTLRRYNVHRNLNVMARAENSTDFMGLTNEQKENCWNKFDEIWTQYYEHSWFEQVFWNIVGEKHNTSHKFMKREANGKYTELISKKAEQRLLLDKVLPILKMQNSCSGCDAMEVTDEMVKAIEPLEAELYTRFGAKGKSKRTKEFAASHAVDAIAIVFSGWAGVKVDVESKEKRCGGGKKKKVFTIAVPKNYLWDCIKEPSVPLGHQQESISEECMIILK